MRKLRLLSLLVLAALLLSFIPRSALAQEYSFRMPIETVHAYWNEDGTLDLEYTFVFENEPSGHPIEFVDLGLPTSSFRVSDIQADIDGNPAAYISEDEFEGEGNDGVAIALGRYSIPPGGRGTVNVRVEGIRNVLRPDTEGDNYASAVFSPAYFISSVLHGNTNTTVVFHLPPGIQPEEPRWHASPSGFPDQPATALDQEGRVMYTWSATVPMTRQYRFGASFPSGYVPEEAVIPTGVVESLNINWDFLVPCLMFCGFAVIFLGMPYLAYRSSQRRKLQYLPPKIAIEGHGIKRGLTAIEAAILLEQPLDKVLTMILFSVIKKGAARVTTNDPLEVEVLHPLPEDMRAYEKDFLRAIQQADLRARRREMQDVTIDLINGVAKKMKGFSRRETIAYYRDIVNRAWSQVEAADTPEVKSEKYDEVMEWTMLDKNYEDRTREVFRTGPIFMPHWYPRYNPTYSTSGGGKTAAPAPSGGGAGPSMPTLPGSTFAASVVGGMQNFSQTMVGNISDFTSRITNTTNPPPPPSKSGGWSGGGGGGSCACACACAGCACACAGGGR